MILTTEENLFQTVLLIRIEMFPKVKPIDTLYTVYRIYFSHLTSYVHNVLEMSLLIPN